MDIEAVVDEWVTAERLGDVTSLRALLATGFVGVTRNGEVLGKAAWLERYRSGELVNEAFFWRLVGTHADSSGVVVVGQLDQLSSHRGRDASGSLTVTLVLAPLEGRWRLVSFYAGAPEVARVL